MMLVKFVEKWSIPDYPPGSVSKHALDEVENQLHCRLPEDYKDAVLEVGLPRPTIALLDAIVERELDVDPIGDFYEPREIVADTLEWRQLGMPENLVAFASDGCGNMFCFDTNNNDSAIFFFDHNLKSVNLIADSFSTWLTALCEIDPLTD
jgi:hypothetical protein